MQATKKPHNYHKTVVWQKDDRIRKSPLKFYVYYYNELSGDCQASIFTELWRLSVAFCVTLWHMSICAGVVVAISFQEVDAAPRAEAGTQGNHQGLKGRNCGLKKCHIGFCRNRIFPSPKRSGGFCSGNSFSRIAPPPPGSVSGVKVSVVVKIIKAQPRLRL